MSECLASIERGYFELSPASIEGARVGCPFCKARGTDWPNEGVQIIELNGSNARKLSEMGDITRHSGINLVAALPLDPLPSWMPPFDIRTSFILDEAAVWFCNNGIIGTRFCWNRADILTIAGVCWGKRIAISGEEMARLLVAHGLPGEYVAIVISDFEFATTAMRHAAGRSAIKKNRDANAFHRDWAHAMRFWGR